MLDGSEGPGELAELTEDSLSDGSEDDEELLIDEMLDASECPCDDALEGSLCEEGLCEEELLIDDKSLCDDQLESD